MTLVVLTLIVSIVVAAAIASLVDPVRQRRVSSRVRVEQLRETLRQAEPHDEVVIRPAASWSLSVEMIMEVAADEGFRLRRDTITSVGQRNYKAMVFVSAEDGGPR